MSSVTKGFLGHPRVGGRRRAGLVLLSPDTVFHTAPRSRQSVLWSPREQGLPPAKNAADVAESGGWVQCVGQSRGLIAQLWSRARIQARPECANSRTQLTRGCILGMCCRERQQCIGVSGSARRRQAALEAFRNSADRRRANRPSTPAPNNHSKPGSGTVALTPANWPWVLASNV